MAAWVKITSVVLSNLFNPVTVIVLVETDDAVISQISTTSPPVVVPDVVIIRSICCPIRSLASLDGIVTVPDELRVSNTILSETPSEVRVPPSGSLNVATCIPLPVIESPTRLKFSLPVHVYVPAGVPEPPPAYVAYVPLFVLVK